MINFHGKKKKSNKTKNKYLHEKTLNNTLNIF